MSEEAHGIRITAVEREVSTIRTEIGAVKSDVGALKADVRGLGNILERIELGVSDAQKRFETDKQASRINPIALTSILISIISILVGGAWLVSGGLATTGTRIDGNERVMASMVNMRDRELDIIERRLDHIDQEHHDHPAAPNQ